MGLDCIYLKIQKKTKKDKSYIKDLPYRKKDITMFSGIKNLSDIAVGITNMLEI
jgi:hypothetical protein